MDAARLLYGELELDASSALFAVNELDEGFDLLAENILETQDGLGGLDNSLMESSEATNSLSFSFSALTKSLGFVAILTMLAGVIFNLLSSTDSFRKVIDALSKAFEPLLNVINEFAEYIASFFVTPIMSAIDLLSEFINYLTKTEQGLALLKVAAIFTGVAIGIALLPVLKGLAVAAYGAMVALGALLVPLLPYIAIGAAVAAAITSVILVLEDLYYFATGEGESVAGGFFAMLGMSPEEIEEVRKSIKEFIDLVKASWESFTSGVSKLAPQLKKIFSVMLAIAKSFFITVFKYIFDLAKIFSGVWDIIKGIFTGNFDLILGGFKKIADGILSIFKSMGNFIADTFNNLLEMIKPIKDIAASLFGGKSPEPIAGARADGGSVSAGKSYLVGEKGAEIFTPSSSGAIIPNSDISSSSMSASGQGGKSSIASIIGTVNIVVQGGENMASDLSQKIKDVIRQASIEAAQELGIQI